ncbi:hypothetical protein G9A89_012874 [Geosiphon pyriformis]|nr:hypothetical protein G9A89_012874 [Geosiphon pyriformis]
MQSVHQAAYNSVIGEALRVIAQVHMKECGSHSLVIRRQNNQGQRTAYMPWKIGFWATLPFLEEFPTRLFSKILVNSWVKESKKIETSRGFSAVTSLTNIQIAKLGELRSSAVADESLKDQNLTETSPFIFVKFSELLQTGLLAKDSLEAKQRLQQIESFHQLVQDRYSHLITAKEAQALLKIVSLLLVPDSVIKHFDVIRNQMKSKAAKEEFTFIKLVGLYNDSAQAAELISVYVQNFELEISSIPNFFEKVIMTCLQTQNVESAYGVYKQMVKLGHPIQLQTYVNLMLEFSGQDKPGRITSIFSTMSKSKLDFPNYYKDPFYQACWLLIKRLMNKSYYFEAFETYRLLEKIIPHSFDQKNSIILMQRLVKNSYFDESFYIYTLICQNLNFHLSLEVKMYLIYNFCRSPDHTQAITIFKYWLKQRHERTLKGWDIYNKDGYYLPTAASTVLQYLVKRDKLSEAFKLFKHTIKMNVRPNFVVYETLISRFVTSTSRPDYFRAKDILDDWLDHQSLLMGSQNKSLHELLLVESCSKVIDCFACMFRWSKAFEIFQHMANQNVRPNHSIYGTLISAFDQASFLDLDRVKIIIEVCLKNSSILSKSLNPNLYDKLEAACEKLFKQLATKSRLADAFELYKFLQAQRITPIRCNYYQFMFFGCLQNSVLDYCRAKKILEDWLHHHHILKISKTTSIIDESLLFACNKMMSFLTKNSEVSEAIELFNNMLAQGVEPNVVTYTSLIDGFCGKHLDMQEAEKYYNSMIAMNVRPNELTYVTLMKGYVRASKVDKAYETFENLIKDGISPGVQIFSTLLNGYLAEGQIDKAENILKAMEKGGIQPNIVTYNIILHNAVLKYDMWVAHSLFSKIVSQGILPDIYTYSILMNGYIRKGNADGAYKVYRQMLAAGINPDALVANSLFFLYVSQRDITSARELYFNLFDTDGSSPTKIIPDIFTLNAYTSMELRLTNNPGAVERIYNNFLSKFSAKQEKKEAEPILDGEDATQIQGTIPIPGNKIKKALHPDVYTFSMFISVFARCFQDMNRALLIMKDMVEHGVLPNAFTYATLIQGYANLGQINEALKFFGQMKKCGLEPDACVYSSLITGWSKVKNEEMSWKLYHEMRELGLLPIKETYCHLGESLNINGKYRTRLLLIDETLAPE